MASKGVDIRVEVKGIPELLSTMERMKIDAVEAVAAGMLAAAFVVSNDAKRRAPRVTGNLARSIAPGAGTDPLGSSGPITDTVGTLPEQTVESVSGDLRDDGEATVYVATNVVYAPTQEFGKDLKHKHGESPYLRPALDENRAQVVATFRKALEQVVKKAGG